MYGAPCPYLAYVKMLQKGVSDSLSPTENVKHAGIAANSFMCIYFFQGFKQFRYFKCI